jgi:threonine/homoserine/homoserine lactone efflux protein
MWFAGSVITISAALGVASVALAFVITPGPNMMYLVTRSLTQGRAAGLISLTGVVTGFLAYLVATALGLSLLFAAVPALFVVFKVAGACYLLWLASTMVRGRRAVFSADPALARHSSRRLYLMGLATCLLNPKIALMYGALLPQFVSVHHGSTGAQILQLGLVQIVIATTINGCWVLLAGLVARFLERSRKAERGVRWTTGGLLAFFAIRLGLAHPAS